jgi:hypothetical protein
MSLRRPLTQLPSGDLAQLPLGDTIVGCPVFVSVSAPTVETGLGSYLWFQTNPAGDTVLDVLIGSA